MTRLTIEIETEQHRQIKTLATFAGMTIKEFILSKILPLPAANAKDTTARLLKNPINAARLRKAIKMPASEHLVFKNEEELKRALGI